MEIRIDLEGSDPPAGRIIMHGDVEATGGEVRRAGDEVVVFEGWLGLVSALYRVLGLAEDERPDGRGAPGAAGTFEGLLAPQAPG